MLILSSDDHRFSSILDLPSGNSLPLNVNIEDSRLKSWSNENTSRSDFGGADYFTGDMHSPSKASRKSASLSPYGFSIVFVQIFNEG